MKHCYQTKTLQTLQDITDESRPLSWFVLSKWFIIACRCIWKFYNKCIEIYELDPARFLSAPGLAWKACLKKTEVKLELLTDIDMLLMIYQGIRR